MPRRRLLTAAERDSLLSFPETDDTLIQHYTFSESDLSAIRQRRGPHNRFGFAVQVCYLRNPGIALPTNAEPPASLLTRIGQQAVPAAGAAAEQAGFEVHEDVHQLLDVHRRGGRAEAEAPVADDVLDGAQLVAQLHRVLVDLDGQFAGRRQDQRARVFRLAVGQCRAGQQAVQMAPRAPQATCLH